MNEPKPTQMNIKSPRTSKAVARLTKLTGESRTTAVTIAVEERLEREERKRKPGLVAQKLIELGRQYSALPARDTRTPEEILGYDENGLPT